MLQKGEAEIGRAFALLCTARLGAASSPGFINNRCPVLARIHGPSRKGCGQQVKSTPHHPRQTVSLRAGAGGGGGVAQQTAFSCCPIKHCSHMLFAASLRPLQRPCPARQPIQQSSTAASEPCSLSSSLPRCHGDTRHLRAVRRLGNGGASAAPPGDPPLPLQPHSRALLVDGPGESRDRRAAGPCLDLEPSESASVTCGHSLSVIAGRAAGI